MTDVLRETLEERGRATPWEDVDALLAAGDRRVRRRRVTGVVAAAAVIAVLAVVTPLALRGLLSDSTQVAGAPYDPAAPSWAADGTVHVGDLEVDLAEQPGAYVLTGAGIVWIDAAYDVRLTDPSGDTEVIGSSDEPSSVSLVTDGRYVAWLDREEGEFVGFDTVGGDVAGTTPYSESPGFSRAATPRLVALDDGMLWTYDQDARANTALDLTNTRTSENLSIIGPTRNRAFLDVAGGAYVRAATGGRVRVEDVDSDGGRAVPGRLTAILSPGATYVVTQARDEFVVHEVRTGLTGLRLTREDSLAPVRWLGDSTLEVLRSGPGEGDPIDVVTCDLPRGVCRTVAEDVTLSSAGLTLATGTYSYDTATVP